MKNQFSTQRQSFLRKSKSFLNTLPWWGKWFVIVVAVILITQLAFSFMNSQSTFEFFLGCGLFVAEVAYIVWLFKPEKSEE